MHRPETFFVFLTVLTISAGAMAVVDTGPIDAVLAKYAGGNDKVSSDDAAVINSFVGSAVDALIIAENIWEGVEIRVLISARRGGSNNRSYRETFISAAAKHIGDGIEELKGWQDNARRLGVQRNLTILTAELKDAALVDLALSMLSHEDISVKYWAVRSITDDQVVAQLRSEFTGNEAVVDKILQALTALQEKETPAEIAGLSVQFASRLGGAKAADFLVRVADLRIKKYADWSVKYELTDIQVLKALGAMIMSEQLQEKRPELCRRFAQLYSYAIQRYILGEKSLSEAARHRMVSVIVEVEQAVVGKLLGTSQSAIQKAIEKKNIATLKREHDTLFGNSSRAGDLAAKLNFNYGKNANGMVITAPAEIGPPPAPQGVATP